MEKLDTARQLVAEGGAANLEAALIAQRDGELPVKLPGRGDLLTLCVRIAVASIPALLAMKGYAIAKRQQP